MKANQKLNIFGKNKLKTDGESNVSIASSERQSLVLKQFSETASYKTDVRDEREKNRELLPDRVVEQFIDAAMYGKLKEVKAAIANGIDVNAISANGNTALACASYLGHISVVRALLDAGANPDLPCEKKNEEGQTALMKVASSFFDRNRAEIVRILVEAGANINARDRLGRTALMHAGSNTEEIKALQAGATRTGE